MSLGPDAVVQVLLRERLRMLAVATAIVRDVHAADDIFQQVVLAALEDRSRFREPEHVLAWAVRAARHRAVDIARRRRLRPLPDEVLDRLEARWAGSAAPARPDRVDALHRCLGKLAAPARDLLRLRYDEGLTAVAIAGRMRRTPDSVYHSLSRIYRALRECVEREVGRQAAPAHGEVSS